MNEKYFHIVILSFALQEFKKNRKKKEIILVRSQVCLHPQILCDYDITHSLFFRYNIYEKKNDCLKFSFTYFDCTELIFFI